jgi:hypothetical protein
VHSLIEHAAVPRHAPEPYCPEQPASHSMLRSEESDPQLPADRVFRDTTLGNRGANWRITSNRLRAALAATRVGASGRRRWRHRGAATGTRQDAEARRVCVEAERELVAGEIVRRVGRVRRGRQRADGRGQVEGEAVVGALLPQD